MNCTFDANCRYVRACETSFSEACQFRSYASGFSAAVGKKVISLVTAISFRVCADDAICPAGRLVQLPWAWSLRVARCPVLSLERQTSVVHSFSEMLDDLISGADEDLNQSPLIVLISPPGILNFAATLAFSALLKLKAVPHLILAQDAIALGKFPQIDATKTKRVYLCYLISPSEAKNNYVLRVRVQASWDEQRALLTS